MREKNGPSFGALVLILMLAGVFLGPFTYSIKGTENIDLGDIDKTFIGENAPSYTGYCVSDAGDVNGDGYDDILIGAYENRDSGSRAGKAYLIFGNKSRYEHHLDLSNANASFEGESAGDLLGYSVSGAGDINGDGYDDFMIGAPYRHYSDDEDVGKVYLFYGKATGWNRDVSASTADATFIGHWEDEYAGWSLSPGGDLNGDGYDDILIGAPGYNWGFGRVYVIFGDSVKMTVKNSRLNNADAWYEGEHMGYFVGGSVSGGGDINGDGFDDIVIGAPLAEGPYTHDRTKGKVYLVYGRRNGWQTDVELSNANASFWGEQDTGKAGSSVSIVGDVNGDGKDDFIVGVPYHNGGGRVHMFLGVNSSWRKDRYIYYSDVVFTGHTDQGDNIGISVSGPGDLDGDGLDDILIGADGDDNGGTDAGICYIIHGRCTWPGGVDIYKSNRTLTGEKAGDQAGRSVSGAGDFNNDGNPDILVGAHKNDDGGGQAGKAYLHFYKLPLPALNTADLVFAKEDELYSNVYNGSDAEDDHDDLDWKMEMGAKWLITKWLTFDTDTLTLSGTPSNADVGENWVNISVGNSYGGRDFSNFTLTVNNTNDPPKIQTNGEPGAIEDVEYVSKFIATDMDPTNDTLNWSVETSSDWLNINTSSGNLTGTPENDDVGTCWVNVTVDDGNGGSDHQNFTIDVLNVNDPPEIITANSAFSVEDILYSVDYEAIDVDPTNDTLQWELHTDADFLIIDNATGVLSGAPDDSDIGPWDVEINVSDGNGGYDTTIFILIVTNVNDDPRITSDPVLEVDEDEDYYCRMYFKDRDPKGQGDVHSWFIEDNGFLNIDEISGEITGRPNNTHVGIHRITIGIIDGNGGSDELVFDLEVINVNDPPVINKEQKWNLTLLEDADMDLTVEFQDIDPAGSGDTMVWSLEEPTNAPFLSIDRNTGRLTGTPTNDHLGKWTVNISVSDSMGGHDWMSFVFTVINVNDAPKIMTKMIPDMTEDVYFTRYLKASDIDPTDDIITWSILGSDMERIMIEPYTGKLFTKPMNNDTGIRWVIILVKDDKGGRASRNFTFEVKGTNDGPYCMVANMDIQMVEDANTTLDLMDLFGDIDGDQLQFSCEPQVDMDIRIENGTLYMIPGPNINGERTLVITASDGLENISLAILLNIQQVNDAPQDLEIQGNTTYLAGEIIRLSAFAFDPDTGHGDLLTFHWRSVLAGLIMNGSEIEFILDPGTYTIILNVTDSCGKAGSTSITIEVIEPETGGSKGIHPAIYILLMVFVLMLTAATVVFVYLRGKKLKDEEEWEDDDEEVLNW